MVSAVVCGVGSTIGVTGAGLEAQPVRVRTANAESVLAKEILWRKNFFILLNEVHGQLRTR